MRHLRPAANNNTSRFAINKSIQCLISSYQNADYIVVEELNSTTAIRVHKRPSQLITTNHEHTCDVAKATNNLVITPRRLTVHDSASQPRRFQITPLNRPNFVYSQTWRPTPTFLVAQSTWSKRPSNPTQQATTKRPTNSTTKPSSSSCSH